MPIDTESAFRFIENNGDASELARLRFLRTGQPASAADCAVLFDSQHPDGGWAPFWATGYSSVDATCFRLAQARQMGVASADPRIASALHFLEGRQAPDGSWQEHASVAELAPPWVAPGDMAAQLYLTANCGYSLALSGAYGRPAELAASFLLPFVDYGGGMPGFLHAHWLAAGLFSRLGQPRPLERIAGFLASRLSQLSDGACAWMLTTLGEAGLPSSHPLVQQAARKLADAQQPDGRWSSEDGPQRDVHATLEALHAFKLISY